MVAPPQRSIQDSRPRSLPVEPAGIPEELRHERRTQWVVWKHVKRGNEWTKQPYDARTGRPASSTDLTTWSAFDEALSAYEAGGYDGVGFVFCSGDGYVGVDLDGCVDPETGEVALWATQIIEDLDSYTELSPSGEGIHVIAKGKIPHGGRRGPVEMYSQDRFFTVTGHVIGEAV